MSEQYEGETQGALDEKIEAKAGELIRESMEEQLRVAGVMRAAGMLEDLGHKPRRH